MVSRNIRFSTIFLSLVILFATTVQAQNVPDPVAGWTHEATGDSFAEVPDEGHGLLLQGNGVSYSAPVVADMDGNPANGLEAAVISNNGTINVYRASGTLLWTARLPNARCRQGVNSVRSFSSPAVGDLFGNNVPHLVVGYGGFDLSTKRCGGGVVAYNGITGKRRWNFNTKRFHKKRDIYAFHHTVYGSPALADTDGDGKMEIGFGGFDRMIFLLNANGKLRYAYNNADTVWSSPVFHNIDDTPELEMLIGSDITGNTSLRPITKDGGYVTAFRTTRPPRSKKKIYEFRDSQAIVWQSFFDQTIFSSPVVADVLDTNEGPEIIIGSGCYFPEDTNNKNGKWIKILNPRNGQVLQTLNSQACTASSVAVGDIDEDGKLEIVATVNGHGSIGGPGRGVLTAWDPENPTPKWEVVPRTFGQNDPYLGQINSPVIADVDGNGSLEVLVSVGPGISVHEGATGRGLTCQSRDCESSESILYASKSLKATPAVADINGDGVPEVLVGGSHSDFRGNGMFYAFTSLRDFISSENGSHPPYSAPWPMYRGYSDNNAVYRE